MRVSLNWIRQYAEIDVSDEEIIRLVGLRLGEVDRVTNYSEIYKDVIIAKVVKCDKHPDADKLSVCLVDDGGTNKDVARNKDGLITVVCGAPNVRAGLFVAWLPPGSTVPSSYEDEQPFVLAAKELRGVMSSGMIASSAELGLSDSHDGILELQHTSHRKSDKGGTASPEWVELSDSIKDQDSLIAPGDSFADTYGLDDTVIDIENKMFTHRPDCFGILGVAREIAAITGATFSSPDWYHNDYKSDGSEDDQLRVAVSTDLVSRLTARVATNVEISPSPLAVQVELIKAGMRPINNIVDLTNIYMHLTAQPLHAFDYDKIADRSAGKATLLARQTEKGEKLNLLNGKTITFDRPAVVIATDKEPVALAGIMGGADTEVDETTTKVIFECATFDMYDIRRTCMHYGIYSDAATRFNKGQSPQQNLAVVGDAAERGAPTCSYSSAHPYVYDTGAPSISNKPVTVSAEFVNHRLGTEMKLDEMAEILMRAEFDVSVKEDELSALAPFWRMDIAIAEDVVEEIGRINGYETIPLQLPARSSKPTVKDRLLDTKHSIRQSLAAAGANELLTYSFVHTDLLKKADQDPAHAYTLTNAISPDLHHYRLSATPSLLDKVNGNVRAGYKEFAVFEIAKTHNTTYVDDGLPIEIETLALVYTNVEATDEQPAYYMAKRYLEQLARDMGVLIEFAPIKEELPFDLVQPYDQARSALIMIDGDVKGIVGEFKQSVESGFKLPRNTAGFEIGVNYLISDDHHQPYTRLSEYPTSDQDLTLQVAQTVGFSELESVVMETLESSGLEFTYKTLSIYAPDNETKNVSFRITMSSNERTLTTEEVSGVVDSVASAAEKKLQAVKI
ncbi:MAG: phenylalanine--tRNA ligase subunit beta [Patescibacteria group bacterium]